MPELQSGEQHEMKHQLTAEDGIKGAHASVVSKRAFIRLEKLRIKKITQSEYLALIGKALENPVISGSLMWALVEMAKHSTKPDKLGGNIGATGFFGPILNFLTTDIIDTSQWGWDALQVAILTYIATGGKGVIK